MHKRSLLAIALLMGLGLFLIPATASAFIFHYGEAPVITGDIPTDLFSKGEEDPTKKEMLDAIGESFAKEMEKEGWKTGYYCQSIFAIMWAYVMLSDCEPALVMETSGDVFNVYNDDAFQAEWPEIRAGILAETGIDLGELTLSDALAEHYSEDDMQLNAWEKHGKWALVLILLLVIGAKFMGGGDDDEDDVPDMSALDADGDADDAGGGDDGGAFSFNDTDTIPAGGGDAGGGDADGDDRDDSPLG